MAKSHIPHPQPLDQPGIPTAIELPCPLKLYAPPVSPPAPVSKSEGPRDVVSINDRRTRDRYRFGRSPHVDFLIKPSFRSRRAAIRDLSTTGVGLVLNGLLEPPALVAIQLRSMTANQVWIGLARVQHATQLENGIWLLGCDFRSRLQDHEVASLIDDEIFETADDEAIDPGMKDIFALLTSPIPPRSP